MLLSDTLVNFMTCSDCGKSTTQTYADGMCYLCLKYRQQKDYAEAQEKKIKMQQGEIRKLPKSNSPMFVEQWSYQGSAKAPYIVSWKPVNHPTQTGVREWQCSCKSWTTTVPRVACKHIIAIQLKEKILVMAPPTKHPLILIKPVGDHVVISKDEHEEYKKFLAARGTRKAGNQFDEEGRKFRV